MRKSWALIAAGSLVVTLAAAGTAPATAASCSAPTIESSTARPGRVVLGLSQNKGFVITVKVRHNGCAVSKVQADVYSPTFGNTVDLTRVSSSGSVSTWDTGLLVKPTSITNADAGKWISYVYVTGTKNVSDYGPDISVARAARLTTNAMPEPVSKGSTVTVKGRLTRADWDAGTYRGLGGQRVALQWRPTGGSYRTIKTATTSSTGAVTASAKATGDGCFRYVFAGSSTTSSVRSGADCVDVS
jgi:hypothetical protein